MMGAFFASLHEPIRCKVWKRENLPTTMLELLDIGISLGDAREVGCSETQNGKTYYEMSFRVNKPKFAKWKWELTKNPEGNFNGKLATPKKFVKRHKWVDAKDAIKIGLPMWPHREGVSWGRDRKCRVKVYHDLGNASWGIQHLD